MITHALYDLAVHPEWFIPLREEIEPIITTEGWTKGALGKMWKLDSLLKESQRFNGFNIRTTTPFVLCHIRLLTVFGQQCPSHAWRSRTSRSATEHSSPRARSSPPRLMQRTTMKRCTQTRKCSTLSGSRACESRREKARCTSL